ncbi:MAG: M20 family metallo-hydrolase [Lachnospiraceae bacterium]|nr:M20 family metallo-hydrolase [Lachnospiraceae bacterium]
MLERADKNRIENWLKGIDQFQTGEGDGTTRILFTEPELKARTYVKQQMAALGLEVTEDAIGNIFGTLKGSDPSLAPVWTGSHIDTVSNAGMFDGMSGIVCGMEALHLIKNSSMEHKRDISVIVYTSEEPERFGLSCLGSRAMAGALSLEDTKILYDKEGISLYQLLKDLGYDENRYHEIQKQTGDVFASVELHIEQNSILEKAGVPIGIVCGICAPTNFSVKITGVQSHAGGTSMDDRRDAFMAAAELALRLEDITKKSTSEYITGTVGKVNVFPNAINVISGDTEISIDIRSIDMKAKDVAVESLKYEAERIEEERKVEINMKMENHDLPLRCDETIMEIEKESCKKLGIPYRTMISGPYHDSLFVGRFAPAAMIFVPSKNGISHSKEEWTDYSDLAIGADVLTETLYTLANQAG